MNLSLGAPKTSDLPDWGGARLAPPDLGYAIAALLFEEAALLDERRFAEWYAWLADDLRYIMPLRSNRLPRDLHRELGGPDHAAHFDEDKASFGMRIKRLKVGNAWAEDPPSRVRRFVSNVVVKSSVDHPDLIMARSYVSAYRSRVDDETGRITAARNDVWRQRGVAPGWELVSRRLIPDDVVLGIGNLSFWF
jgi:3-phenylpropionate/cinnamic acid dioxygenase small subunit